MSSSAKRKRNGDSDNSSDEMEFFTKQKFTQQRQLIYEKLLLIENEYKETFTDLVEDVKLLKQKVLELEKENVELKNAVNTVNQSNLSNSVIIYGVPKDKNISDSTIVKNIGEKLNISVTENDLSDTFRIRPRSDEDEEQEESSNEPKCPPLVVKFTRKTLKTSFMKQRGKKNLAAADIGIEKCTNRVYINEYLTKNNLELLKYAQKLKKYDIKYVWPAGGKILVKNNGGNVFSIDDKDHVDSIIESREQYKIFRESLNRSLADLGFQ